MQRRSGIIDVRAVKAIVPPASECSLTLGSQQTCQHHADRSQTRRRCDEGYRYGGRMIAAAAFPASYLYWRRSPPAIRLRVVVRAVPPHCQLSRWQLSLASPLPPKSCRRARGAFRHFVLRCRPLKLLLVPEDGLVSFGQADRKGISFVRSSKESVLRFAAMSRSSSIEEGPNRTNRSSAVASSSPYFFWKSARL